MEHRSADCSSLAAASAKARHLKLASINVQQFRDRCGLGTVLDLMERAIIGVPMPPQRLANACAGKDIWLSRRGTAPGNMATGRVIGNLEGPCLEGVEAGRYVAATYRQFTCTLSGEALMKIPVLRYYMHEGRTTFRIELAGEVTSEDAWRIDQDWRVVSSKAGKRRLIVDMTYVTRVDDWVRALFVRWHQEGAQFVAASQSARLLAEWILGEPVPESTLGDLKVS